MEQRKKRPVLIRRAEKKVIQIKTKGKINKEKEKENRVKAKTQKGDNYCKVGENYRSV